MTISILGFALPGRKKQAKVVAQKTLEFLGQPTLELSVKFVGAKEICRLNKQFRGIDKSTDVLSFPATNAKIGEILPENEYLGDMAICMSVAKQNAKKYNNSVKRELSKLVSHSILHMLGYDHIEDKDYLVMQQKENEIEKYLENNNVI